MAGDFLIPQADVETELRSQGFDVVVMDFVGLDNVKQIVATKIEPGTGREIKLHFESERLATDLSPVQYRASIVYERFNREGVLPSEPFRAQHPYWRRPGEGPPHGERPPGERPPGEHGGK